MTAFKVGDRVRYTGTFTPRFHGAEGVITSLTSGFSVRVKFDGSTEEPYGCFPENLKMVKAVAPTFKVGDLVRVRTDRHGKDQYGDIGYIEAIRGSGDLSVTVKFAGEHHVRKQYGKTNSYAERDLELYFPQIKAAYVPKVGDRVRITDKINPAWWAKPGDEGVVETYMGDGKFNVSITKTNSKVVTGRAYRLYSVPTPAMELAPAAVEAAVPANDNEKAKWIIIVEGTTGKLEPALSPKEYVSEEQAWTVANRMAEKSKNLKFHVFKSVGSIKIESVQVVTEKVVKAIAS